MAELGMNDTASLGGKRKCEGREGSQIAHKGKWRKKTLLPPRSLKVKDAQLCLTLCNRMDYTVHGILQARILEWIAFPFSRGSSQPRDRTQVSHTAGDLFTSWVTGKPEDMDSQLSSLYHTTWCKRLEHSYILVHMEAPGMDTPWILRDKMLQLQHVSKEDKL